MPALSRILPALVHIQAHLDQDLSLDALADRVGLSKYHFHELFESVTGETPKAYVERLRLEWAAVQLRIRRVAVVDVALECVYRNHETFSRAFRRRFRTSPSAYRKQWFRLEHDTRRDSGSNARRLKAISADSTVSGGVRYRVDPNDSQGEHTMAHPVIWFEVIGNDGDALRHFYAKLFGWTFDANNPIKYGIVDTGAKGGIPGGIGQVFPGTRPWTTFYVETPDVTASLGDAERLGGKVVMPRTEMPDVTLGVFEDPEGHVIGLVEARSA